MLRLFVVTAFASLVVLAGPAIQARETEIPLDEVPDAVVRAAMEAVPGIELVSAEIEEENGETLYELEGMLDGERYEIEITPEGEVIEIETGDDDHEDEGEEDTELMKLLQELHLIINRNDNRKVHGPIYSSNAASNATSEDLKSTDLTNSRLVIKEGIGASNNVFKCEDEIGGNLLNVAYPYTSAPGLEASTFEILAKGGLLNEIIKQVLQF